MSADLSDFLNTVPPPLTVALLQLGPSISFVRRAVQVATWSAQSWQPSWLALALYWTTCLLLDFTLEWLLPFAIAGLVAIAQWQRKRQPEKPPLTESTLQTVVSDLTIIQSSLPTTIPLPPLSISAAFRVATIVYIPYVVITRYISLRVVCAIAGTVLLSWRAPWAIVLRATVWRSAWVRWSLYKSWAFLTGEPLPPQVMSPQPTATSTEAVQSLRFLFTIYENQRWWMGLDWTAALLPGERPSWCSGSQQPMSPPNGFCLPESSTVYLSDGKGGRLKRTATWRWEEPEWRVLIHKDGSTVSRVERPLPSLKDETPNSSRLLKAAGRLRDGQSEAKAASSDDRVAEDSREDTDEELLTDADGWVYGDNKWENPSNKGGMGKYTRHRRWTRIAIVFELVEPVSPGPIGIERHDLAPPPVEPTAESAKQVVHEEPEPIIIENPPDSPLRQRLKNALHKPTH